MQSDVCVLSCGFLPQTPNRGISTVNPQPSNPNPRSKRLGNLKGGADDVKRHKWFKGLDFDALLRHEIPPPIVPEVRKGKLSNSLNPKP